MTKKQEKKVSSFIYYQFSLSHSFKPLNISVSVPEEKKNAGDWTKTMAIIMRFSKVQIPSVK
jgi:hypothetical protein